MRVLENIVFIFHHAVGVTFGLVSEGTNHFSIFVILAVGVVHAAAECDVFIKMLDTADNTGIRNSKFFYKPVGLFLLIHQIFVVIRSLSFFVGADAFITFPTEFWKCFCTAEIVVVQVEVILPIWEGIIFFYSNRMLTGMSDKFDTGPLEKILCKRCLFVEGAGVDDVLDFRLFVNIADLYQRTFFPAAHN